MIVVHFYDCRPFALYAGTRALTEDAAILCGGAFTVMAHAARPDTRMGGALCLPGVSSPLTPHLSLLTSHSSPLTLTCSLCVCVRTRDGACR
jgi:hypothetical protein